MDVEVECAVLEGPTGHHRDSGTQRSGFYYVQGAGPQGHQTALYSGSYSDQTIWRKRLVIFPLQFRIKPAQVPGEDFRHDRADVDDDPSLLKPVIPPLYGPTSGINTTVSPCSASPFLSAAPHPIVRLAGHR